MLWDVSLEMDKNHLMTYPVTSIIAFEDFSIIKIECFVVSFKKRSVALLFLICFCFCFFIFLFFFFFPLFFFFFFFEEWVIDRVFLWF